MEAPPPPLHILDSHIRAHRLTAWKSSVVAININDCKRSHCAKLNNWWFYLQVVFIGLCCLLRALGAWSAVGTPAKT